MKSLSTSPVIKRGSKDKPSPILSLGLPGPARLRRAHKFLFTVLAAIFVNSSPAHADWIGESRPMMGTEISVYLWHDDPAAGQAAVEAVFAEAMRIDEMMSTYKEDSILSKINREAAKGPVSAGDELYRLIVRSLDISVLTLGAFDVTYDSVGQHYDFRERRRPNAATIEDELQSIDYRLINIHPETKSIEFARDGVRINLGGIAKGYTVEQGVNVLRSLGIYNNLVNQRNRVKNAFAHRFAQMHS